MVRPERVAFGLSLASPSSELMNAYSFNVKQIKCIEAKLTKVTRDMEALENKSNYNSIFKGILKQHINKRRRKKENRRMSNERKRKRTENNVQRVYGICVGNPLGNDLPQCLVYPPRTAVPEECIKVEDVATLLFRRDGPYIAQLLEGNYFTTNLEQEVRDYVYTFMYPEEYTLTESIAASSSIGERDSHSSTSGDEELDDSEDEDECQ